ncbi:hypothetical protein [Bradyrhizobium cytisi]|uniref:Uncharacterized protein n=1 Tax=Bradyrhizobium cytisi TaxID=515489 RepID=A0A5S4WUW9_9BRAD|nr:hypothetical protein [Bradyrhizobium cytisi]TYL84327.1 hypothetical protein FXB38_15915 [Bradyrhizobium cytisi]
MKAIGKEFVLKVRGHVKGHPDPAFQDGDKISTTAVFWFDRKSRWIRTAQRVYLLGEQAGDDIPLDGVAV